MLNAHLCSATARSYCCYFFGKTFPRSSTCHISLSFFRSSVLFSFVPSTIFYLFIYLTSFQQCFKCVVSNLNAFQTKRLLSIHWCSRHWLSLSYDIGRIMILHLSLGSKWNAFSFLSYRIQEIHKLSHIKTPLKSLTFRMFYQSSSRFIRIAEDGVNANIFCIDSHQDIWNCGNENFSNIFFIRRWR